MKEFTLSMLASLAAAILLSFFPFVASLFEGDTHGYLDVEIREENFGDLNLTRVVATNSSELAFAELRFVPLTDGHIVRVGIEASDSLRSFIPSGIDTISGTLDAKSQIVFSILIENGRISKKVDELFSGVYSHVGQRGRIETKAIKARSQIEKRLTMFYLAVKWGVVIIIIFSVTWVFRFALKRKIIELIRRP